MRNCESHFAASTRGHWVGRSSPLLSGLNFWTRRMTLILLDSERFAPFWTQKEVNAMRHQNTVLHQILQYVPWTTFDALVEKHGSDKHIRRLTTQSQFVAML
jgi:hypothetical protein